MRLSELNERRKIELKWRIHLVILLIVCKGFKWKADGALSYFGTTQCHSPVMDSFLPFCHLNHFVTWRHTMWGYISSLLIHPALHLWPNYLYTNSSRVACTLRDKGYCTVFLHHGVVYLLELYYISVMLYCKRSSFTLRTTLVPFICF